MALDLNPRGIPGSRAGAVPPSPRSDDHEDVAWALSTAEAMWGRGDRAEAVKWVRRAAEAASEAEQDDRALELAKAGADLATLLESGASPLPAQAVPPPPPPPQGPSPVRSAPPPSVAPPKVAPKPPTVPPPAPRNGPIAPTVSAMSPRPPAVVGATATRATGATAAADATARVAAVGASHATNVSNVTSVTNVTGVQNVTGVTNVAAAKNANGADVFTRPTVVPGQAGAQAGKQAATQAATQAGTTPRPPLAAAARPVTPPSNGARPAPSATPPRAVAASPKPPRVEVSRVAPAMPVDEVTREVPPVRIDDMDQWPTASLTGDELSEFDEKTRIGTPAYTETARLASAGTAAPARVALEANTPKPAPVGPTSQALRVVVYRTADGGVHVAPAGTRVQAIACEAMLVALDPGTDLAAFFAKG